MPTNPAVPSALSLPPLTILGASWGHGVLTYGHRTYSFEVKGLKVLAVGLSKASVNGEVYKLTNATDLAGTYKDASQAGLTFIKKGEKDIVVQNEKGVVINVKGTATGMNLGLVEGGLTIKDVK